MKTKYDAKTILWTNTCSPANTNLLNK